MTALHHLTLIELAAALATGETSARAATETALARIAALDGRDGLNAFVTVTADQARAAAAEADTRRARGEPRGPLDGIPLTLKDLVDTAGVRTTAGSRVFADRVPSHDATVARRLRAAGAVVVGKTNLLEFAYGYPHPDFGETVNPWNRSRTAGGSSGGSAAAVAAGMAHGALGSDTGGSIRSPAAYCGITGLKPSYGLVITAGVVPLSWSLDHVGPVARTAADCALLLAAIGGHDPADPASASTAEAGPAMTAVAELARSVLAGGSAPASLRGVRVGAVPRFFAMAVTPGLAAVVDEAVRSLAVLGAEVVEVDLPLDILPLVVSAISQIYGVEAAVVHRQWLTERPDDYGPTMRAGLTEALTVPAVDYVAAQRDRLRVPAAFADLYTRVDLLAWPAQPLVAPPLGTTTQVIHHDGEDTPTIDIEIGATGPANLTGEPSISLPCDFATGLPVGLLLQAPRFADAPLLRAAIAYQTATGFPPLPPLA